VQQLRACSSLGDTFSALVVLPVLKQTESVYALDLKRGHGELRTTVITCYSTTISLFRAHTMYVFRACVRTRHLVDTAKCTSDRSTHTACLAHQVAT
jgi:hypothetical protein